VSPALGNGTGAGAGGPKKGGQKIEEEGALLFDGTSDFPVTVLTV